METINIKNFAEQLVNLTVLEVKQLVELLKNEYGIEPKVETIDPTLIRPIVVQTEIEKTEFDLILKSTGPTKLQLVRKVKELTNLSLTEAKSLVDGAPIIMKEGISKIEAEILKGELESVGAEVELR